MKYITVTFTFIISCSLLFASFPPVLHADIVPFAHISVQFPHIAVRNVVQHSVPLPTQLAGAAAQEGVLLRILHALWAFLVRILHEILGLFRR